MQNQTEKIVERTKLFAWQVEQLRFSYDCYIYNPLDYAWPMHEAYLRRYLGNPVKTLLLGMNPGPFGMAQTGVPFGEINAVKTFLELEQPVGKPVLEHPKRPVLGLAVERSEVSGRRLWGLLKDHYEHADNLIGEIGVSNYCPLVFMERTPTAKNITPDKLPKVERMALEAICDCYLQDIIELLEPTYLIGVGKYALKKFQNVVKEPEKFVLGSIIHPSPGNPQANQNWNEKTTDTLRDLGVWL